MLPCMTNDLLSSLYRRDIIKVPQLLDVPLATLQALCGNSAASRLKQDLQRFPTIHVQLKVQIRNSGSGEGLSLNVRLKKSNSDPRNARAFAPRFPKEMEKALTIVAPPEPKYQLRRTSSASF